MGLKEDFQDLTPAKCLVVGFVLCVVYYFVFYNKGEDIVSQASGVQEEISGYNKRLDAIQQALNNKAEFERKVVAFTKELEDLLRFFPTTLDMNEMQKELTEKLKLTENKLIKITEVETVSRFKGYTENGVEIETLGGFHEIMSFLSAITKMNRVVDFRAMDLESQNPTDEFSMIRFKLKLSIFAQEKSKPPEEKPPGAGQ
ncbi:MAG: type 4a pilus biogenesis protein PilO [Bdellovibrionaceae bacterium]|nr:type 4a pilus biogenesis protein PilO [Pseudobdellovibrionaceae bacterium]